MNFFSVEFWQSLVSNLVSDLVLFVGLTIVVTSVMQRAADSRRVREILGLHRAELFINRERALKFITHFETPDSEFDLTEVLPLRYTRGVWNSFKDSGFLREVDDIQLIYHLLRLNELTYSGNRNLRQYELAAIKRTKNIQALRTTALRDIRQLLAVLNTALEIMDDMNLPEFDLSQDMVSNDDDEDRDD